MLFFPPPSPLPPLPPLPPSPLSGCVRCGGRSGGAAAPAVIRDGPNGRTTKTCYGTSSAAAATAAEATEEEDYDGCDGANPRHRLDEAILSLANGILLHSIVVTTAGAAVTAVRSTATATMSMPAIDDVAVYWVGGLGGQQRQHRHEGGRRQRQHVRFLGGRATPTLRWAFLEDDTGDDDDVDN